jgi:transcriptional regulator of acetoin/glycerol metabolism
LRICVLPRLERCLAAALVLADRRPIDTSHLPAAVTAHRRTRLESTTPAKADHEHDDDSLRVQLAAKLTEHRGNISAVARDLSKHREQVQRWIRRFGFDVDLFRRDPASHLETHATIGRRAPRR